MAKRPATSKRDAHDAADATGFAAALSAAAAAATAVDACDRRKLQLRTGDFFRVTKLADANLSARCKNKMLLMDAFNKNACGRML